jgi:hypothetical protein
VDAERTERLRAMRAKAEEEFVRNPIWQQPGWVAAHARLLELLPAARERIDAPYRMSPDPILESATAAGVRIDSILIYNPWRGDPAGRGTKAWEEYEKVELFDEVFRDHPPAPGPLWFIPDVCFSRRVEPYSANGESLREFVAGCRCDLTDDALFIWAEAPRVTVIHHAGGFFHLTFAG